VEASLGGGEEEEEGMFVEGRARLCTHKMARSSTRVEYAYEISIGTAGGMVS
jgi:hypothetical protein